MKRKIIEPMLYLDSPNVNERSAFGVQRLAFGEPMAQSGVQS
jgi:hypothetical protein